MLRSSLLTALLLSPAALGQGYLCAEGGGSPTSTGWGAAVFGWMVTNAPGGDVVVIGSSGTDPSAEAAFLGVGLRRFFDNGF